MKCLAVLTVILGVFFHQTSRTAAVPSATVAAQIRTLLQDETTLRQHLGNRVNALSSETRTLAGALDAKSPCQCNSTRPTRVRIPQVSYTGTLPSTLTSLSTSSTFNFKNDLVNVGQPFNVTSGNFTVPVSGVYGFSLTIYMGSTGYWTALELVKNDQPFLLTRTGHYSNRQVNMATNFALVNATAGDDVWTKYVSSSGTRVYADGVSTMTGVLLYEL